MRLALIASLVALFCGCRPQIGDDCVGSVDCSQQGDRLCDTSQPDGYCTVFNCDPDRCPEEAVCVGFQLELDPSCPASGIDTRWPRFSRTFCMYACEADSDCRDGYKCVAPPDRNATSLDSENVLKDSKVCFAADGGGTNPLTSEAPVCSE